MKDGDFPKYEIIIYWDDEDNIFVAEVPELPGCMSHGESEVEAVRSVRDAIDLWLSTAREFGDEIPVPRRHPVAA